MRAAPPDEVFCSAVLEVRDVWTVEGRVYCEVRTASGWVATCLLVAKGEWHVCHGYRLERGEAWRDAILAALPSSSRRLEAVS